MELPNVEPGGGPAGVKEQAEEGGGPAGVVDGFDPRDWKILESPTCPLSELGVVGAGSGLDEAGTAKPDMMDLDRSRHSIKANRSM